MPGNLKYIDAMMRVKGRGREEFGEVTWLAGEHDGLVDEAGSLHSHICGVK